MKNVGDLFFPGLNYPANQLAKFINAPDLFTILVKSITPQMLIAKPAG